MKGEGGASVAPHDPRCGRRGSLEQRRPRAALPPTGEASTLRSLPSVPDVRSVETRPPVGSDGASSTVDAECEEEEEEGEEEEEEGTGEEGDETVGAAWAVEWPGEGSEPIW